MNLSYNWDFIQNNIPSEKLAELGYFCPTPPKGILRLDKYTNLNIKY